MGYKGAATFHGAPGIPLLLSAVNDSRAKEFINALHSSHSGIADRDGPFIVAFDRPLTGLSQIKEHLYFDLTGVPPDVASLYVHAFLVQAGRQDFWRKDKKAWLVQSFAYIERSGQVLSDVERGFSKDSYLSTIFGWFGGRK